MPFLATAKETGTYGEKVAAAFLRRQGYKVLTRNFATPGGEIDLVCRHGNVLAFVEVRSRSVQALVRPLDTIGKSKEATLLHAALKYLDMLDRPNINYRFDAVEVILDTGAIPRCNLVQDIF